jgi:hypothetical protein
MMKDLDKSPGMCSDYPQITPKSLDLAVSPHVLEREREGAFGEWCSVWWGRERDIQL